MNQIKMSWFFGIATCLLLLNISLSTSCAPLPKESYSTIKYPYIHRFDLTPGETRLLLNVAVDEYDWEEFDANEWGWAIYTAEEDFDFADGSDYISLPSRLVIFQWVGEAEVFYIDTVGYTRWNIDSNEKDTISTISARNFAVSPNGDYLAEFWRDDTDVTIYRLPEYEIVHVINLFEEEDFRKLADVSWSKDSTSLMIYAQFANPGLLKIDVKTGMVFRIESDIDVGFAGNSAFDWHSDENLIVVNESLGGKHNTLIYDLSRNCRIVELNFNVQAWQPAWSEDGRSVWMILAEGRVPNRTHRLVRFDLSEEIAAGRDACP